MQGRRREEVDYFDDSLIQSSWARDFSAFQSVTATSQLTMCDGLRDWAAGTVELTSNPDVDAQGEQQRAQNHSQKHRMTNLR